MLTKSLTMQRYFSRTYDRRIEEEVVPTVGLPTP